MLYETLVLHETLVLYETLVTGTHPMWSDSALYSGILWFEGGVGRRTAIVQTAGVGRE